EPDDLAETSAITNDPDAGVETIIVEEKARPASKRITARQLPAVSDERSLRAALEATRHDPAGIVAARPPNVINPSAGARPPNVINPSALAGSGPRAQPIADTLRPPPELAPTLYGGPQAFAPAPGSQPRAIDPRLRAAPAVSGTEVVAGLRARVPRRLALFGGLAAIAVGSFLLALVVCSPPRTATALDAALVAEAADARPTAGPDAAAAPPAAIDASIGVPTIRPDAALQLYKVDTRPPGGTVRIGDQQRTAPAELMLPPGRYTVTAELDGWQPETRSIELVEGAALVQEIPFTRRIHIVRAPQTGTLTVRTTPYSDVYIGTRKIGQAPFAELEVPAGTYSLTFKNPRHPTVRKQITIVAGKLTRLPPFTLPPPE
ncbi:MAG TPA: PEGA domain-containing protein, partial [Kofleriaceae bacterium]|nr:PEGA domain-containing protein [Kofleriaceae bacterium]